MTKLIVARKQEITRSLSLNTMKESPVAIISLHHYVSWPGSAPWHDRARDLGLVAGGRWWPVVAGEAELTLQLSLNLPQ